MKYVRNSGNVPSGNCCAISLRVLSVKTVAGTTFRRPTICGQAGSKVRETAHELSPDRISNYRKWTPTLRSNNKHTWFLNFFNSSKHWNLICWTASGSISRSGFFCVGAVFFALLVFDGEGWCTCLLTTSSPSASSMSSKNLSSSGSLFNVTGFLDCLEDCGKVALPLDYEN